MLAIDNEFLTVAEAAAKAGVSEQTVRRAVKRGQLRYRRREGVLKLLSRHEVEQWITSRKIIEED